MGREDAIELIREIFSSIIRTKKFDYVIPQNLVSLKYEGSEEHVESLKKFIESLKPKERKRKEEEDEKARKEKEAEEERVRKAKEEEERKRKEEAEKARKAKEEEEERIRLEKAEEERKRKEEEAEKARKAKEEEEEIVRKAKEEEDRKRKEEDITIETTDDIRKETNNENQGDSINTSQDNNNPNNITHESKEEPSKKVDPANDPTQNPQMSPLEMQKAELAFNSTIIFDKIKTFKESGNQQFRQGKLDDAEKYYKEGIAEYEEEEKKIDLSAFKDDNIKEFFQKECWTPIENLSKDFKKNLSVINFKRENF